MWRATKQGLPGAQTYSCQATELLNFTAPLKWWDMRQYVETYRSGNETLGEILRGFAYLFYYYATLSNWPGLGRPGRWLYDRFQMLWGGVPFPRRRGNIPVGAPTPRYDLGLQPGDLVRVKPYQEILATLDTPTPIAASVSTRSSCPIAARSIASKPGWTNSSTRRPARCTICARRL